MTLYLATLIKGENYNLSGTQFKYNQPVKINSQTKSILERDALDRVIIIRTEAGRTTKERRYDCKFLFEEIVEETPVAKAPIALEEAKKEKENKVPVIEEPVEEEPVGDIEEEITSKKSSGRKRASKE